MHKSILAAAAAALAGAAVFAQEATPAPEFERRDSVTTRADVAATTARLARAGGISRNDADAQRIAAAGFAPQKTRIQVRAERVAARRLGLMAYGEAAAPLPTADQLDAIRSAGLHAVQAPLLAARP